MTDLDLTDGCELAYITAGAGGMICGSCLHDNTLVRALNQIGVRAVLVPTYTPIRTDETDVSVKEVFFGGINVFLRQKYSWWSSAPRFISKWLDHPWLLRKATSRPAAINARFLGLLTVSMLKGLEGNQRREVIKLAQWLKASLRPRIVLLTNVLIAGSASCLKETLGVPLLATLQGDDIFLDSLVEPYRSQALSELRGLCRSLDGFLVHSRFYAEYMQEYLGIPSDKIHVVPLGIDTHDFAAPGASHDQLSPRSLTIGYLARIAPEKGLHLLVDAFRDLRRRDGTRDVRLRIAGWLGEDQRAFAQSQFAKLDEAGLAGQWSYDGVPDRAGKVSFLRGVDVFSVPTVYRDPKGLSILESLAAGVPVVQPAHGAFPEMLHDLGGGLLIPPLDSGQLADALHTLLTDEPQRRRLGREGAASVHSRRNARTMAENTWRVCREFLHAADR